MLVTSDHGPAPNIALVGAVRAEQRCATSAQFPKSLRRVTRPSFDRSFHRAVALICTGYSAGSGWLSAGIKPTAAGIAVVCDEEILHEQYRTRRHPFLLPSHSNPSWACVK